MEYFAHGENYRVVAFIHEMYARVSRHCSPISYLKQCRYVPSDVLSNSIYELRSDRSI
jgi:hypothetical protein